MCLEPRVSGEGGERLYQALPACLSLSRLPTVSSGKDQNGFPLLGPREDNGA